MSGFLDNKFIFSNSPSHRIGRHLVFWFLIWVQFLITHAANPLGSSGITYFKNPVFTFAETLLLVIAQFPTVYVVLYLILPKLLLRKKYFLGVLAIIGIWFLSGMLNLYLTGKILPELLKIMQPGMNLPLMRRPENISYVKAVLVANRGGGLITVCALMLKFGKQWYTKQFRNLQLQKEYAEARLQLLTAQVHPHFLFNTLSDIYSKTQVESPDGSKMIMGLSDMLRYILYEGQKPLVPLKQELAMIKQYINLETIRYGNKLDVHMLTPDRVDNIFIAPLLLLPFVENCFKHGTSNVLQNPWINLTIELKDATLVMKLMNGKAAMNMNVSGKPGIGIRNVRQRLELLYKDKYDLQIREDEEVFVVDLRVKLVTESGRAEPGNKEVRQAENAYV